MYVIDKLLYILYITREETNLLKRSKRNIYCNVRIVTVQRALKANILKAKGNPTERHKGQHFFANHFKK